MVDKEKEGGKNISTEKEVEIDPEIEFQLLFSARNVESLITEAGEKIFRQNPELMQTYLAALEKLNAGLEDFSYNEKTPASQFIQALEGLLNAMHQRSSNL